MDLVNPVTYPCKIPFKTIAKVFSQFPKNNASFSNTTMTLAAMFTSLDNWDKVPIKCFFKKCIKIE